MTYTILKKITHTGLKPMTSGSKACRSSCYATGKMCTHRKFRRTGENDLNKQKFISDLGERTHMEDARSGTDQTFAQLMATVPLLVWA